MPNNHIIISESSHRRKVAVSIESISSSYLSTPIILNPLYISAISF